MSEPRPFEGLNPEQRKAAAHLGGPLLIEAGAGSGKTRTLTQRVVAALTPGAVPRWQPVSVEEVLAITFTEKAAGEIGERVRRALRKAGRVDDARRLDAAWFSTIHGLCSRLLRRHALEAGIDPAFAVLDEVEAHRLRERAFEEAAAEAIESSEAAKELFGRYGFEAIASATGSLERELHARALDASALILELPRDPRALLDEALTFFERMASGWEACPSVTATADSQREGCAASLASLRALDAGGLPPDVLAGEVWRVLDEHPKPPARLKGAEDLLAEMVPERTRLLQEAACASTARHADALRSLVAAYRSRYAAAKRARGGLDFDDLQLEALRLLEGHPSVAERHREQFRLVMVDEFQDTDSLQLALVRALGGENLCTVGDERQSIYRFRGADLDVYREHVGTMMDAGALRVPLAENYRSHPDVLAFVNGAFGAAPLFGDTFLRLEAARDEAERPVLPAVPRVQGVLLARKGNASVVTQEAAAVAERFAELREAGVPTGSMAVLLRAYRHADEFAAALRARGMQALVVGGSRFFERPEVETLRALCRAIANVNDDDALARVLASPVGGLSDDALWLLRNDPSEGRRRGSLAEPLLARDLALPLEDAEAAERVCAVLERGRERVGRMGLSEILLRAVEESGWDLRLLSEGDGGRHAYANVLKFARLADAFEASGGAGPAGFAGYLDAKEASGDREAPATLADEASPCVRIMSIHASKGLEFAVVALPQLGDGPRGGRGPVRWRAERGSVSLALALPSDACSGENSKTNATPWFAAFDAAEAEADEAETKRLLYVGCTRAEEMLLLTGATNLEGEPTKQSPLDWLLQASAEVAARGGVLPVAWERREVTEEETPEPELVAPPRATSPPPPGAAVTTRAASAVSPPDRLSYSDIALYRRCGLRFYAEKVLRLGRPRSSRGGPRAFGSAVHAALQLSVAGEPPDETRLDAIARAFGVAGERSRLRDVLTAFLASPLASELADGVARTEVPFVLPIGSAFLLRGTMDAYARDGGCGLVVDYKTGTSGGEAELRERFALQAACYGLVALRDGCEIVRVVFVRPEVAEAGGPQAIEFAFEPASGERIEAELLGEHRRIAAGEYGHLPEWDRAFCEECAAAATVCPLGVSRRQASQR